MQRTGFWLRSITRSTVRRITAKWAVVALMSLMLGLGSMLPGCGGVWKHIKDSTNSDSPPVIYGPIPDTAGPVSEKPAHKK